MAKARKSQSQASGPVLRTVYQAPGYPSPSQSTDPQAATDATPDAPRPPHEITADLLTLITRFFATFVLAVFAVVYMVRREIIPIFLFGGASLIMQYLGMRQYRRLKREREAIVAAREATPADPVPVPAKGE